MNICNNFITSAQELNNQPMNYNHNHLLCPFNYCSCLCCICNCCFGCQCLCHQLHNKTTRNNYSTNNTTNISSKTPLSNYSNKIYQRNRFKNNNDIYESSPNKNSLEQINLNNNNISKRIFQERLTKYPENKNTKIFSHSRSLSQLSHIRNRNRNENINYSYHTEKNFNKSFMTDFHRNNNRNKNVYFIPSTERQKILNNKYNYNDNDKYINIRGTGSEEKNIIKTQKIYDDRFNLKANDFNNKNYISSENEQNILNSNNYFKKNGKYRSCLNSASKNDKIIDSLINNRKRKDIYLDIDPNKNLFQQNINNNNKKNELLEKENNFINNDFSNNKLNNSNERKNIYKPSKSQNHKLINIKNIKQKNPYKGTGNENYNYYENLSKYNDINNKNYLDNDSNEDNYSNNNDLYNNHSGNQKYQKLKNNNNFVISSFSFSINNFCENKSKSLIDINEIKHIKNELISKNKEIQFYKNKINLFKKQLEFFKNENIKLKKQIKQYSGINKRGNSSFIYRKKSKDEINSNNNENNDNKKENNSLKNLINKGNDFQNKNRIMIPKKEETKINNKRNNKEKLDLSSKLNIKTDLNISKDNDYISLYLKNNNISDKCVYAISSLTKSKSILCFDFINKNFSFRDYADFGEFQENYLLSFENNNQYSKNNSIYLVIRYNYYIVTGENCDMLYVYNSLKRTMNKLCNLKNNHSNGALINYSNDIICISGNFNKKVELFNHSKNEWKNLPELNIERRDFSTCLIKNKYIFCLFGYNFPTKQYLNTIEFLNIENYNNSSWKYLEYKNENLLSLYISNNEKIIIVGGNNKQENIPNEYFYQIIISENFEKEKESYAEKTKRKLKDIHKNKCYIFNKGYNLFSDNNLYCMALDDNLRVHVLQVNNMAHDIFYFE